MAAAEPASVEANSHVRFRFRQRLQGLTSSHLTRAVAQCRQACDTRPAPGEDVVRRRFLVASLSFSWLAACRLRRSARAKALPHTWQKKRLPSVWVWM
jgi:hypothetical protein